MVPDVDLVYMFVDDVAQKVAAVLAGKRCLGGFNFRFISWCSCYR
jgi:hypothetical protein